MSAPIAVVAVYLLTIVVTVPFGAAMHTPIGVPVEPVVTDPTAGPTPDFDWLDETASKSGGLVSTLAPVVIGVAAPLSNLSSLVDGHPPPLSILMISAIYFVVWIVAWGGIVQGLSGPRVGLRACITASRRSWLSIARLGLMGLGVYLAVICDASSVAARRGPSRARLGPERTREFRRSSRPCRNIRAGYVDRLDGARRLRAHRSRY